MGELYYFLAFMSSLFRFGELFSFLLELRAVANTEQGAMHSAARWPSAALYGTLSGLGHHWGSVSFFSGE